jgi:hypothetical protein
MKLEAQGILCADIGEVVPGQGVKVVKQDQVFALPGDSS